MTVALGLVCSDGVLVASDSMGSDGMTASFSKKVHLFGRSPVMWTGSGSKFVSEEVAVELQRLDASGTPDAPLAIFTKPDLPSIRGKISPAVNKAMRAAYGSALSVAPAEPGQGQLIAFATNFLVLGYANDQPWFLEYSHDGQVNWHTDTGFYAVGSGGQFATVATALMSHYLTDRPTLQNGKMIAYRAIETTIAVSSQSVGMPVQMAVCDNSGARLLSDDELEEVHTGVDRWKELERESLFMTAESATEEAIGDLPTLDA